MLTYQLMVSISGFIYRNYNSTEAEDVDEEWERMSKWVIYIYI